MTKKMVECSVIFMG